MTPLWQVLIGVAIMLLGGGLIYYAYYVSARSGLTPLSDLRSGVAEHLKSFKPTHIQPVFERIVQRSETGDRPHRETKPTLITGRAKHVARHEIGVDGLLAPINDVGRVELKKWASNIANNIYIRCTGDKDVDVRDTIRPGNRYTTIDTLQRLAPVAWIQVIIHEGLFQGLKHDFGLTIGELCGSLAADLRQAMKPIIDPVLFPEYQPRVQVFRNTDMGASCYNLRFNPLLPNQDFLICDGAVSFQPSGGKTRFPEGMGLGGRGTRFRIADKAVPARRYAPLVERYGEIITIGPHPWHHIQTDGNKFSASLTLGWRKSDEIGVAGVLEILDYAGNDALYLEVPGFERVPLNRARTFVKIPVLEGAATTCTLYRVQGEKAAQVGTMILANPLPDVASLPDVLFFEDLDWSRAKTKEVARFLASQIYLATRVSDSAAKTTLLHEPAGRDLLVKHGLMSEDGELTVAAPLTADDELRYRLKLIVSSTLNTDLKRIFGNVTMRHSVVKEIIAVIEEDDVYKEFFSQSAKKGLRHGDTRPGLSLEIAADPMLRPGSVLLSALPILTVVRRREIFGELQFSDWTGARDISGMSSNDTRNFLIQYPTNRVRMRLSRYPLYGIVAPRVNGVIEISLEAPGQAEAQLVIENHCQTNVNLDGREIAPSSDLTLPVPIGREHRSVLKMGAQSLTIILYPEPIEQMREPEFLPAPGKLNFFGLTLGRRGEVTQYEAGPLNELWRQARESGHDLALKGAGLVTQSGYLVSLIRDEERHEVHYFTGRDAKIQEGLGWRKIPAGGSSLKQEPLGLSAAIFEEEDPGNKINYYRVDFQEHPDRIVNADILLADFHDLWFDEINRLLPETHTVTEIDLVRCHPDALKEMDRHLYIAVNDENLSEKKRGWLFHPGAGIRAVHEGNNAKPLKLNYDGALVGPLDVEREYRVDWEGEEKTFVSFRVDSHENQFETYLFDGFYSLAKDNAFCPGGVLAGRPARSPGVEDIFLSKDFVRLNHGEEAVNPRDRLPFNPKAYCNYFDQDSFRVGYSAADRAFLVRSLLHPHTGTRPKTVFMIVPSGSAPILGSHALPGVVIPPGRNYLVFPGLTFLFSQGPVYYGFNV